jgi:hypothetical protein
MQRLHYTTIILFVNRKSSPRCVRKLDRATTGLSIATFSGANPLLLGISGNEIVSGAAPQSEGSVEVSERLGGLLSYYYRRAAWDRRRHQFEKVFTIKLVGREGEGSFAIRITIFAASAETSVARIALQVVP